MDFPHLSDNKFPYLSTADPYAGNPAVDYRVWGPDTRLSVVNVPWDNTYDDVAGFETVEDRDAYLDGLEGVRYTFDTAVHVMPDRTVKLPIPAQALVSYNYIVVDLPAPPVPLGSASARRFCFFLGTPRQTAPNTSIVPVELDVWCTYATALDFTYLNLERGHWPVAQTSAADFLACPIERNRYLTTPDVTYGDLVQASSQTVVNLGAEPWFCVWASTTLLAAWGSKQDNTWTVPGPPGNLYQDGTNAVVCWAIAPADASTFLDNIDSEAPQFKRCVLGYAFIDKSLISTGEPFTAFGVAVRMAKRQTTTRTVIKLTADLFGYPAEMRDFAKLYTYPYAAIEVTDGRGTAHLVRVEETSGTISLQTTADLIFPYIGVQGSLLGVGGTAVTQVTSSTASSFNSQVQGLYYNYLMAWEVPVYAVAQRSATTNDYATHYDREQAKTAYTNANANTLASATAAKTSGDASADTAATNATASANTSKANADNAANTAVTNTGVTTAASSNNTASNNSYATSATNTNNYYMNNEMEWTRQTSSASYKADQAAIGLSMANARKETQMSQISGVASAIGDLVSGDFGGAFGGLFGLASTSVSGDNTQAALAMSQSNSTELYTQAYNQATNVGQGAQNHATAITANTNAANTASTKIMNDASTTTTANSAKTAKTNAANTQATSNANTGRTQTTTLENNQRTYDTTVANAARDLATSQAAVTNSMASAALQPANLFGSRSGSTLTETTPTMVLASVVTQTTGDLWQAAAQFMRYGYELEQPVKFDGWNVMTYFSYWKLSDVWWTCGNAVDAQSQRKIRDILESGVTVWRWPETIGVVTPYDNQPA